MELEEGMNLTRRAFLKGIAPTAAGAVAVAAGLATIIPAPRYEHSPAPRYEHSRYALEFIQEHENSQVRALAAAMQRTKERVAADVFNRAFSI